MPGTLSKREKPIYFYVNSGERNVGVTNDFQIFTEGSGISGVTAYAVDSITVPFTWFTTRPGRDTFQLTSSVDGILNFSLAPGTYSILTFVINFNIQLNLLPGAVLFTTTFNNNTGRMTVNADAGTVEITVADLAAGDGWISAGFRAPAAAGPSITSDSFVDITGNNRLYVTSKMLGNRDAFDSADDSAKRSDIISDVMIDQNFFGVIHDKKFPSYGRFRDWPNRPISNIDFQLRHEDTSLVDLNGAEWQMTLILHTNPEHN